MPINFALHPVWCFGGSLLLLLLSACSDSNSDPGPAAGGTGGAGGKAGAGGAADTAGADSGGSAGEAGHAGDDATDPGSAGSAGEPSSNGGSGGKAGAGGKAGGSGGDASGGKAGDGSAGTGGRAGELMTPCDVDAAYTVCRNCHQDPPINQAPMPLITLVDLQLYAGAAQIAISSGAMPAEGRLTPAESTLILNWLSAGANGVPKARCE